MAKIENIEEKFSETYRSTEQPPPNIVAFNELRSCADLFRLHEKEQIDIHPFFQRECVWTAPDQTRFIDSLVKQLPIPSMCFAFDYNTRKWIVIDGLQRMTAIVKFLNKNANWTLSRLEDIDPNLSGKNSIDFHDEESPLHSYIERVENLTLPITVLRCDFSDESHMEYLFKIFHRLNAGGVRLNSQEIRNCIYSGSFNNMLIELDKDANWVRLKSHINGKKDRFRSMELALRILAFSKSRDAYKGNLARFLNDFMFNHRRESDSKLNNIKKGFVRMSTILVDKVIPQMESQKFGFTQFEALAVGVVLNIGNVEQLNDKDLKKCIKKFEQIELLKTEALSADISRTESVKSRLKFAIESFK